TLRPLGPRVTLTARASLAMPRRIASRASWSNAICFAAILPPNKWCPVVFGYESMVGLVEDRQHVFLAHEEDVGVAAAFFVFIAGPGGEEDGIAHLDLEVAARAVLEHAARPDGEDLALLRLVLGVVGQEDAARGLFLGLEALHDD